MAQTNGHDPENVTPFPDPADRKRIRAEKERAQKPPPPPREPILNLPPATKHLSLVMILVFGAQEVISRFGPHGLFEDIILRFGFIPARYSGHMPFIAESAIAPVAHLFLHAGWLHMLVNTFTLLAFGGGVEKMIGGRKLLLLFFLSGIGGALAQFAWSPALPHPLIGASGGVSGLFGAVFLLLMDKHQPSAGWRKFVPFVLIWVGISLFFGMFGKPGTDQPVSWMTHIAGLIVGMALCRSIARYKR
ncbi:MAG: rhomboid family intramembrane serine protease [Alphaproteobacteria bacterium]|nr:rhomboid family intramembrane serine protease [Alphaproteobacteria bacterium]